MPPKSSGIKSYRYLCSRVIWKYKRISVATEEKSVSNPISSQNWTEADCLGKSRAHLPSNRLYRPIPRNPPIPRPSSPPEEMPADRKGRHFWVDSSHIEDKKSDV